jgi:hypothetical protein
VVDPRRIGHKRTTKVEVAIDDWKKTSIYNSRHLFGIL